MTDSEAENLIVSLRQQLADELQRRWDGNKESSDDLRDAYRQLAESQAMVKVLREALDTYTKNVGMYGDTARDALALPSDSTALDSAIRQAKREALLEAVEIIESEGVSFGCRDLNRMANELG
jgi:hypothetical protein